MKKIGMLVAVEMDAVLRRYGTAERREKRSGFEIHVYDMGAYELYAIRSGAGEISAAAATQILPGLESRLHGRALICREIVVFAITTHDRRQGREVRRQASLNTLLLLTVGLARLQRAVERQFVRINATQRANRHLQNVVALQQLRAENTTRSLDFTRKLHFALTLQQRNAAHLRKI